MKRLFAVMFAVPLLLIACVSPPKGKPLLADEIISKDYTPVVQPWEDGLRTDPAGKSFEWWYFDSTFSDGSTAVVFFSTKSFLNPAGKAAPQASIVITDPKGNKIEATDKPGISNFSASTKILDVEIGKSYLTGNLDSCDLYFNKGNVKANLHLVSKAPAWRPGSGISYYDDKKETYFAWLPSIPYGIVTGTLEYNGKKVSVTGTGYHDHNWGNVRLNKIKTQWYWGRARIDDYTLIFSQMLTAPKYGSEKVPVFYLAKGDKVISKLKYNFNFKPSEWKRHEGGRDYPTEITMNVTQDNLNATIFIDKPVLIEAKYLLDSAPWIVRVLSRPFSNPYYLRFKADFNLNITEGGKTVNKKGSGLFEMMLLRGLQTVR